VSESFLATSDRANPDLPRALKRHGAQITEVIAYRTLSANRCGAKKI